MTEAPERIWIQSDHIPDSIALDRWDVRPDADEAHLFTGYIRKDVSDALVATAREARQISDVPEDGTWAVLHPGYYGAFTACALYGKWMMCDDSDLRLATHWVPCPFTSLAQKDAE